jgi:hypothetical protein
METHSGREGREKRGTIRLKQLYILVKQVGESWWHREIERHWHRETHTYIEIKNRKKERERKKGRVWNEIVWDDLTVVPSN